MAWLLDTNVLSELRRTRPNERVVSFVAGCRLDELYVSVVTLAEIRFGIEQVSDTEKRTELSGWLERNVRPLFAGRILDLSENVLLRWRLLVEEGRKSGHTFSQPDLMIAATALEHGLTVVTRDLSEYEKARVQVLNPWVHA